MRTGVMKWIDHWVGLPLCVFFGFINKAAGIFFPKSKTYLKQPSVILISKYFGIGSIVLISSLMRAIRKRYPSAKIVFITFKTNEPLLKLYGLTDKIISIDNNSPLGFLRDVLINLFWLSFHRPDIAIDLEFYSKFSNLINFLSGAKVRFGFDLPAFWRKSMITNPIKFDYNTHISLMYKSVADAMAIKDYDLMPVKLDTSTEVKNKVRQMLINKGIDLNNRLIGINVNASDLALCRRWPAHNFIALIEELAQKEHVAVILTGSASEVQYTFEICNKILGPGKKNVFNTAGEFTLNEFIALLGFLALFITNDSGPFHLAYSQEVPTVSLWGPGAPSLYGPLSPKHKVLYSRYPCSPCMYIYRKDASTACNDKVPCMEDITPRMVAAAASELAGI